MNIDKIMQYKCELKKNLSFEEIMKLFSEILYNEYGKMNDSDTIHCYQLTRDMIDILTQMINGRKFEEDYLKKKIKW